MSSDNDESMEGLRATNARLRAELEQARGRIAALEETNRRLQQRIAELERENARQAAPFRREPAKKVPAEEKKRPGRKPGHQGAKSLFWHHVRVMQQPVSKINRLLIRVNVRLRRLCGPMAAQRRPPQCAWRRAKLSKWLGGNQAVPRSCPPLTPAKPSIP